MEKPAGALVDRVLAVAKDTSIARDEFREALFRFLIRDFKACGQPFDVALCYYDVVIRTAVSRAFRAVVEDRELSVYHIYS